MKKTLLIESTGIVQKPVLAENERAEHNGKWTASIWKLGERNLNGRVYPKELGERIVKEGKNTLAYDGHDVNWISGEEYGIAKAICSNPRIEGTELRVDIEFVDSEYESRLRKIAEAGVPIGVSSVGYGDVDETTGIVNPLTYQLVRYLDFVSMPAGEVYAKMEERTAAASSSNPTKEVSEEGVKAMANRRQKVAEAFAKYI